MLVYDTALEELIGDELAVVLAVEEGEEDNGGEEDTVNPVLPTGGDIIYAAIFFFALWAAMKYVLLPPVQKVRAERAAKIAAARDAGANASADMGSAQADYDAALADARAEGANILDAARAEADAARSVAVDAASAEAAELRAVATAEISVARNQSLFALSPDVAAIAAGAASTVLGRTVDVSAAQPMVDRALSQEGDS